jgi:hypothetical protein
MTKPEMRLWLQFTRLAALIGLYAFIAFRRWRKRRMENLAQAWPSVIGRLHDGHVDACGPGDRCIANFNYDYFVGEYRAGTFTQSFSSQDSANDFIQSVKDKKVPIHYNPSKPDDSVLEPDDLPQPMFSGSQIG